MIANEYCVTKSKQIQQMIRPIHKDVFFHEQNRDREETHMLIDESRGSFQPNLWNSQTSAHQMIRQRRYIASG